MRIRWSERSLKEVRVYAVVVGPHRGQDVCSGDEPSARRQDVCDGEDLRQIRTYAVEGEEPQGGQGVRVGLEVVGSVGGVVVTAWKVKSEQEVLKSERQTNRLLRSRWFVIDRSSENDWV